MNIEIIKQLAGIVSANSLSSLSVEENGLKISITKQAAAAPTVVTTAQTAVVSESPAPATTTAEPANDFNYSNLTEVKSPLVGVFYSSPTPDSLPYVSIGSKVKKGDTLCIVEAMKLMNEITAECDGEIADICIKNGDIAEYGQVLFKIL